MRTKMTHRILANGTEIIRGDYKSIGMIYNNLLGINRSDWQTHDEYMDGMERMIGEIRGKQLSIERIKLNR